MSNLKEHEVISLKAHREKRLFPAEWKRCCRCFPSCVSQDGFCGCCYFDHRTGERLEYCDPDDIR